MQESSIVDNEEEEEPRSPTNPKEGMAKMDDEEETMPISRKSVRDGMIDTNEEEPTMPWATQRLKVGSNDVNKTPLEIGLCNMSIVESDNTFKVCKKWNKKNQVENRIDKRI